MSDEQLREFRERARRLAEQAPKEPKPRRRFPWRFLLLLAIGGFGYKAGLLIHLGAEDYEARVRALEAGTAVERAGAVVMARDPFSDALADIGARFVRH